MESPGAFLDSFAHDIRGHEHFRSLLITCEPEQRGNMYESLRHRLRFTPKPLDVYVSEGAYEAERKQLPELRDGIFHAYRPMQFRTLWSTVCRIPITTERLLQSMRNLLIDVGEEKKDEAIFKVHVVTHITDGDFLRISAGLYIGEEPQRIQ